MSKILITGGAGFIGLHLAEHLGRQGHEVVLIDNFFRGRKDATFLETTNRYAMRVIEADLTNPASTALLGNGYQYIYHLAAINGTQNFYDFPHEVLRVNVASVMNILEWMRTSNPDGKILFTSSSECYAGALEAFNRLPLPTPEQVPLVIADVTNPRWSYAGSKIIGEQFFLFYAKAYNLKSVIVRPHNFYGPRDLDRHVLVDFVHRILDTTDPFPIFGGQNTRTFCYISDAIEALQRVIESDKSDGAIYHVCGGAHEEITMESLAHKLFTIAQWSPQNISLTAAPMGSVLRRVGDNHKVTADTGWQPKTSLDEGLQLTYAWYKNNNIPL